MSIRASCGHELTDSEGMGIQITLAEIDRDGSTCIKTGCCCNQCAEIRKNWQSYVSSKEEEEAWFEQHILPGDFRKKKMQRFIAIKSYGSVSGEVDTQASLAEMQRDCPGFFKITHGKRESYTIHRGCMIVRNTTRFSDRPVRRTAVYLYFPKGFVDSPKPDFLCVGPGNSSSIRTAKKYIDLILNRGECTECTIGEWND